ncbi:transcriptional regulator with XRE-family HTH domain [Spinactinospora alkalitolerans]|uniref:Transcriptional regulator with XRE-family HTH domain n=1 Tax=Spinactinospora alkalitolerans TaxID=687207 RepID=A0A852U1K4_9ACTN|nr:XRE family transcriptional regulator [Spinactinospora alkalitolerans]NYE47870.1 transcriptional regulator with XRE-family HTH domain [Spinactinospora alkalitolerans]
MGENGAGPGARIREYRTMRRMTVRSLAQAAQASPSFISQLERGRTNASIGTLRRITTALGITMADLFDDSGSAGPRVTRRARRPRLEGAKGVHKSLISQRPLRHVEVYSAELDPAARTGDAPYSHGDAQEIFMVLHGRVRLWLGPEGAQQEHDLHAGDSIEYPSSTPHLAANAGEGAAEVLWIISPPTPD